MKRRIKTSRPKLPAPKTNSRFGAPAGLIMAALALGTLLLFFPVAQFDFVTLDDPDYVTANVQVENGITIPGLKWAFQAGYASNWHPLTWISHMLDTELFGPSPRGPHLMNLLLHIASVLVLFHLLRITTNALWPAAFTAALFAWHPLHTESVAWIAERKDVLSTLLFLLTIMAYVRYAKARDAAAPGGGRRATLVPAIIIFALAVMSKPMVVTLPIVLLLIDFWPLRRMQTFDRPTIRRLLIEKIPFAALSIVSSILTVIAQHRGGSMQSLTHFPIDVRLENAMVSYARYIGKTFWPADLAVLYPHPGHWPAWQWIFASILFVAISIAAIRFARQFPFIATGWFWFAVALVPVIGVVQVGEQSIADRYTYLPHIGLFIALAWSAAELCRRKPAVRDAVAAIGVIALGACLTLTHTQLGFWRNSETLYRRAIDVSDKNHLACKNLANYLVSQNRLKEAIEFNLRGLEINPDSADLHSNLGATYTLVGDSDAAIRHFQRALELQPDTASFHNNLGYAFAQKGELEAASASYAKAIALDPNLTSAYYNRGLALATMGRHEEAIESYQRSLDIYPAQPRVRFFLARSLVQVGRRDDAIGHLRESLQLDPSNNSARELLQSLAP